MPKFTIDYRPDIEGTNELMTDPEMVAVMAAAAQEGKEYAEAISPIYSGEYIQSFRIETEARGGPLHNRAEARLINDSAHAAEVEWLNHGGGERILGRTVDFIEGNGA